MSFSTFELLRDGPTAEVRLNRPQQGNPVDARFRAELDSAAARLRDEAEVRCVLLTAAGDVFSSGKGEGDALPDDAAFRCLEELPQPVIAAIDGDAVGAGLELALACDMRIASERATFAMPEVAMGSLPSLGGTQRLPRIAGRTRAAEMILLGEPMSAAAALACGLVNEVTAPGAARARAGELAAAIAARGPLAVRYAKEAILRGLDMPLEQALRYETDLTVILQTTGDRAEGVRAFLEKRAPRFSGR